MGMSAAHCQGISECLESGHPVIRHTAGLMANGQDVGPSIKRSSVPLPARSLSSGYYLVG